MTPDLAALMQACAVTWPAARSFACGPFTLRDGQCGGRRVSAATLNGTAVPRDEDRHRAEERMADMGRPALFQLRADQTEFDAHLDAAGYRVVDPTNAYVIPAAALTDIPIPRVTTFCIWEPLAIMKDLWAAAGIDAARLAVMHRATCPKTGILGRIEDNPAACAYVGLHDEIAMLHALEVVEAKRRKGMAQWMMRQAAIWAERQGGKHLSVLCTQQNTGANALYRALGFELAGSYHYRILRP